MAWYGAQASGGREYSAMDYQRVVRELRQFTGRTHAVRTEDFVRSASLAGLEPRTIRAILSDADGTDLVIVEDEGGTIFVAEYADETEAKTHRLLAQAKSLAERAERRRQFAESKLPRRQMALGIR